MSDISFAPSSTEALRERARARLEFPVGIDPLSVSAAPALRVLYDLATSPDTAADALALLHELQVHQVELDLQAEDMRSSSEELQAALARQAQLYDAAPFAYLVVDLQLCVTELNATGVLCLGAPREMLLGQRLERFLTPQSTITLHGILARVKQLDTKQSGVVVLHPPGQPQCVSAVSASPDPAGTGFLVVLCPLLDGSTP